MILSDGKNNFKNNEFSFWEWSAPILQTHDEVVAKIKELSLRGRVIKSFYTVGMAYDWSADDIADKIYNHLEHDISQGKISAAGPFPFLPEGVYISRCAQIDEPFLIEFEDGDILGIDYSEGSSVRLGMNTIPKDVGFGTNRRTIHPNALFTSLIGKEIIAIEITTSTECNGFTWSHGLDLDEQDAYLKKISIVCKDAKDYWEREKLEFSSFYDYGVVALTDYCGESITIHAPDVKEVVKGFIDESVFDSDDEYHFDD